MFFGGSVLADIFLSYARADQPRVEKLAAALEAAGYSVWWDRHLGSGAEFANDIERALAEAKHVIVCWSEHGIRSRWVRDEASEAADQHKLLSLSLDGTVPPMGFRQYNATDISGWKGGALPAALLTGLGRTAVTTAPAFEPQRRFRPAFAVLAALALGSIAFGAFWFTRDDGKEEIAQTTSEKSIAILPFRDLSPEQEAWFSDGLAQEISAALARTPDLKVAPTSESFRFREREQSMAAIGLELGVAHILDGSVRRSEDRIVVDIELIETASGERLFTQRYDRPSSDTITVQEDIATRIASALDTALDPEALAELVDSGTNNVEAYELALRATSSSLQLADNFGTRRLDLWRQAIAADPDWVRPYVAAASGINNMLSVARLSYTPNADRSALSAEADRYFDRAAELATSDRDRLVANHSRYIFRGEFRRALQAAGAYLVSNPDDLNGLANKYQAQLLLRDYAGARATLAKGDELVDQDDIVPYQLVYGYFETHQVAAAVAAFERLRAENEADAVFLQVGFRALLADGRISESRALLRELEQTGLPRDQLAQRQFQQACADGDRATAERLLPQIRRPSSRWSALTALGRKDEATELLRQFDFAEPPYALLDMMFFPNFDPRPYPNLMKIVERENIPIEVLPPRTPACPAPSRTAS